MKYTVFWHEADSFHLLKRYLLNAYYVTGILQSSEDIIISILLDVMKLTYSLLGKHTLQR